MSFPCLQSLPQHVFSHRCTALHKRMRHVIQNIGIRGWAGHNCISCIFVARTAGPASCLRTGTWDCLAMGAMGNTWRRDWCCLRVTDRFFFCGWSTSYTLSPMTSPLMCQDIAPWAPRGLITGSETGAWCSSSLQCDGCKSLERGLAVEVAKRHESDGSSPEV